jgi:hypothetical protein
MPAPTTVLADSSLSGFYMLGLPESDLCFVLVLTSRANVITTRRVDSLYTKPNSYQHPRSKRPNGGRHFGLMRVTGILTLHERQSAQSNPEG